MRVKIQMKITLKKIITFLAFIISLLYVVIFYNFYFARNDVYATEETTANISETEISQAKEVDIENIIEQNVEQGKKEEYSVEETILEYLTIYRNNPSLPKGTIQVVQEGREGKQEITTKKTYKNEELISEEQISSKITKGSVNKIVEIGTSNYTSSYKVKVGDKIYVTSDRLPVRFESNENSQKVATLTKQNELKVLEIQEEWYKISCEGVIGYVKAEGTTYINNNAKQEINDTTAKSKTQLTANLDFGMALNKPSGLTLEQFKKILSDSKDVNKVFENNAEYFYYIEQQYNINGVFVAAVGIHEELLKFQGTKITYLVMELMILIHIMEPIVFLIIQKVLI